MRGASERPPSESEQRICVPRPCLSMRSRRPEPTLGPAARQGRGRGGAGQALPWSNDEDTLLCAIVHEFGVLAGGGTTNWVLVADVLCGSSAMQGIHRTHAECQQRFRALTARRRLSPLCLTAARALRARGVPPACRSGGRPHCVRTRGCAGSPAACSGCAGAAVRAWALGRAARSWASHWRRCHSLTPAFDVQWGAGRVLGARRAPRPRSL